jgi:hypothetical protein
MIQQFSCSQSRENCLPKTVPFSLPVTSVMENGILSNTPEQEQLILKVRSMMRLIG